MISFLFGGRRPLRNAGKVLPGYTARHVPEDYSCHLQPVSVKMASLLLFFTASRPAVEPTQPPIQCVSQPLSLRVKQLGCEADHLYLFSDKVKNFELYLHSPIRLHGVVPN
jgi:hypothetical protein